MENDNHNNSFFPNNNKQLEGKENFNSRKRNILTDENFLNEEENIKLVKKEEYLKRIHDLKKQLNEMKTKLINTIHQKKKELKTKFGEQNGNINNDLTENSSLIEKITVIQEEKQKLYDKNIIALNNYLNLNKNFSNIIDQASKNLLAFLSDPVPFDKNQTFLFMLKHEAELNTINIYGHMTNEQCNKIYNKIQDKATKKYISKTNYSLKKLKIDSNSNIADVKELLASDDQTGINNITIDNISNEDFSYIFCKDIFILNRFKKENTSISENSGSSLTNSPNLKDSIKNNNDKNENKYGNSRSPGNSPETERKLSKINNDLMDVSPKRRGSFSSNGSKNNKNIKSKISCNNSKDSKSEKEKNNNGKISIKNCNLQNLFLSEIFPNISILKLYNCKLDFNFYESFNFKTLSELYFDKLDLVDFNFNEIIYTIYKNSTLKKSLTVLSFEKNQITFFNTSKYVKTKWVFDNLEVLNLSNNKISCFETSNFNSFPKLKILDLSNNLLPLKQNYQNLIKSIDKFLILLTGNIALMQKEQRKIDYIKYLNDVLAGLNFPLKRISLQGLFSGNVHKNLYNFTLTSYQNSLIEINLSRCDINDKDLVDILSKNLFLYNLKIINISKNKLTDAILDLSVKNNLHKIFNKLKVVNISFNDIHFSNGETTKIFLKNFCTLETLILKNTPIEEDINNFIKKEIIFHNENKNQKKIIKHNYNEKELLIQELFNDIKDNKNKEEKGYFLKKNTSIKIFIRNILENNTDAKQLLPQFFERINMT